MAVDHELFVVDDAMSNDAGADAHGGTLGHRLGKYLEALDRSDPIEALSIAMRDIAATARHLGISETEADDLLSKLDANLNRKVLFESRLLDQFPRFLMPSELRESETFFRIGYLDSDLLIPVIDTLVYIGKDEDDDGRTYAVFVDAEIDSGISDCDAPGRTQHRYPIDSMSGLFTFERALERLMICSLARKAPFQRSSRTIELPDGRCILVKGFAFIGDDVYALNYFTECESPEGDILVNEVDDIWAIVRPEVEQYGFSTAMIVAHRLRAAPGILPEPPAEFRFSRKSGAWIRE